jgi:hypothetical protein
MNPKPTTTTRHRVLLALAAAGCAVAVAVPAAAQDAPASVDPSATTTSSPTTSTAPTATPPPATTTTSTTSTTATPTVATPTEPSPLVARDLRAGTPTVRVTPSSGLLPDGGTTITVTGSGFDPVKNNKVGVYVVFGPKDPGTYFSDANRFLAAVWVHPGGGAGGSGQAEMAADGSFTVTLPRPGGLPLTATYTDGNGIPVDCRVTGCQVITMAAHGVPDRSQDTFTPVSFAATGGSPATTAPPGVAGTDAMGASTGTGTGASTGGGTSGASPAGSTTTGATGASGSLAQTGADVFGLALLALVLVAGGLLALNSQATRQLRQAAPPSS